MDLPRIAVTLGDPAGIGPEVALKAVLDPRVREVCRPLLVGDHRVLMIHGKACGLAPRLFPIETIEQIGAAAGDDGVEVLDLGGIDQFELGRVSAAAGRAAIEAAQIAIAAAMAGRVDAVAAAPQTELAIKQAGIEFDGYPAFVARCTGTPTDAAFLMLCFDQTRIAHATLHVSLRRAIELITAERLERVFTATDAALKRMGIRTPRIAVSGLNPHASENGMFGDEELQVIGPAIAEARKRGLALEGPFGADTMFQRPSFDGFIVMFHDQGHLAAKLLATNRSAAVTIGTPVLFASVAHGSGLDIAGKNCASPEAMVAAIRGLAGRAGEGR